MEMSSQLYIILTLVESQMAHSSLLRYRSRFVWQSIRNILTVEWERLGVCKCDLIHRNLGEFFHYSLFLIILSPLFRAGFNANFHMLLPVKLQTVEIVSCGVKQLSAVTADLSSWGLGSEHSNTHLCHSWILSQVRLVLGFSQGIGLTKWQWGKMDFPAKCSLCWR